MTAGSVFKLKPQSAAGTVDAAEVRRALAVFADPAAGCFVQGLPWAHWECLPGGDLDGLVAAVGRIVGATGTYFGMNPCPVGKKLIDSNVIRRRWMLFDFDSTPAHAKKRNATEGEREDVHAVAAAAADYLMSRGWTPPVMVDSGNGTHLLYRLDMPNNGVTRESIKAVLLHVAALFDTPAVHLGTECYDARRISKLPGTFAKRGGPEATGGRTARLVSVPEPVEIIPAELLTALANEVRDKLPRQTPAPAPERGPVFLLRIAGDDLQSYAKAGLIAEASRVRMAAATKRNTILNDACFRCGTMVGAGWIMAGEVEAEMSLAAHACGLMDDPDDGMVKTLDTIRRAIRDGAKNPRPRPAPKHETNGHSDIITVTMNGEIVAENSAEHFAGLVVNGRPQGPKLFELLTVGEIIARELPEPNWAIPGLLSEGLNLLAGSPKMGKSMLALNLGLTIAGGGKALDDIQTAAGDVLYLSLEDKLRRVKARAVRMLRRLERGDVNRRLTITTEWLRADQGGLELCREWVRRVERPTLLVVDVLGRFRTPSRERGNQYEQDNQALYAIKSFVDSEGFSALVVTHTRKQRGDDKDGDPFEGVSGTQGITGACDGILLLRRQRQSNEATVEITGRDGGERKLALEFDETTFSWRSLGTAEEHLTGKLQLAIVDYLKKSPGRVVFLTELATSLGEDNPKKLRVVLNRLCDRGIIRRQGNGFVYPGPEETEDVEVFS